MCTMKRLTIHNRTNDAITFDVSSIPSTEHRITTLPGASTTVPIAHMSSELRVFRNIATKGTNTRLKESASPSSFTVHVPLRLGASWRAVNVDRGCPWIMYRSRVSQIFTGYC